MRCFLALIIMLGSGCAVAGTVDIVACKCRRSVILDYVADATVLAKVAEKNISLPADASWLAESQVGRIELAQSRISAGVVASNAADFAVALEAVTAGSVVRWSTDAAGATGASPDNCIAIGKSLCTAAGAPFLFGGGAGGSCRAVCGVDGPSRVLMSIKVAS